MATAVKATVQGSANIAVIKYWGKRDVPLNLPINSSLSATLDNADLCTTTTATVAIRHAESERDSLQLNGEEQDVQGNGRLLACLAALRAAAREQYRADAVPSEFAAASELVEAIRNDQFTIRIESTNNFPTAAGLASSASGYCCLVYAVACALKLKHTRTELSVMARLGSGSASRSLFGGWARWEMGTREDGLDSCASVVADEKHWEDMRILVLVACKDKKHTPSTSGMQRSVATSPLIGERIRVVPERMKEMERAILAKDFNSFATLTMTDSDHFHEVCHTSDPPIRYMNDVSRSIVTLVRAFNATQGRNVVAYTFDAGPNAVLYLLNEHVPAMISLILKHLPPSNSEESFISKQEELHRARGVECPALAVPIAERGSIESVLCTKVGSGPALLEWSLANK